jgi:hypothetical protein
MIVFMADLPCYDLHLYGDENVNRMQENLDLFKEISSLRWFRETLFVSWDMVTVM